MPHPEDHGRPARASETGDDLRELRDQLDATFRAELSERLPRMRLALRRLAELTGDDARGVLFRELAREAHSIKGGALVVGRESVARIAAALELRFDREAGPPSADPLSRTDTAADALTEALDAIESLATSAREADGDGQALAERVVAPVEGDGPRSDPG